MNTPKKLLLTFILLNLTLISNSSASFTCSQIGAFGNLASRYIENQISDKAVGMKMKLTKRKTLHIRDVHSLRFTGCTMKFKLGVKLERKIRRDATGTIGVRATVSSFSRHRVCLKNVKVTSINLSHTTGLGEAIYKAVANKVIHNNTCYNI